MEHPLPATLARLRRAALIAWASPASLLGLTIGLLGLATGGSIRRGPGILEFHGGALTRLMDAWPIRATAMTLGHVVLGRSAGGLDYCQAHELVHVRQYERWGPLFIPAYLASSLVMWIRGRHPYYDNRFEREAFAQEP